MTERLTTQTDPRIEVARLTQAEAFAQILGLDIFPSTPKECPPILVIPPEALGALGQVAQSLGGDPVEKAQNIRWGKFGYALSPVKYGDFDSVVNCSILEYISRRLRLITWHSHPGICSWRPDTTRFSLVDALMQIGGCGAYIDILISKTRETTKLEATVHTRQSITQHDDIFWNTVRFFNLQRYWKDILNGNEYATLLARFGLAYYVGAKEMFAADGTIMPEKLNQELKLIKVQPHIS